MNIDEGIFFLPAVSSAGSSIRVRSLSELDAAMGDVFGAKHKNDLVFLDAHIDPEEHVYPMSIKGGSLKDMILERSTV